MKRESLKSHLRAYSIVGRRKTTINHAFASAIAPHDDYDDELVVEALVALGQDPESDLYCGYCDKNPAETWDHVFGLVKGQQFSGFGHTIGNLLPCCKQCNSSKGNKNWREFVSFRIKDESQRTEKINQLERYFSRYLNDCYLAQDKIEELCPDEMRQLKEAHDKIIALMEHSDKIAVILREKIKRYVDAESEVKSKSL